MIVIVSPPRYNAIYCTTPRRTNNGKEILGPRKRTTKMEGTSGPGLLLATISQVEQHGWNIEALVLPREYIQKLYANE